MVARDISSPNHQFKSIGVVRGNGARKGDQLFVEGRVRKHHWTAKRRNEDYTFVVTGFRFGAKPGDRGSPVTSRADPPHPPSADAAEGVLEAAA